MSASLLVELDFIAFRRSPSMQMARAKTVIKYQNVLTNYQTGKGCTSKFSQWRQMKTKSDPIRSLIILRNGTGALRALREEESIREKGSSKPTQQLEVYSSYFLHRPRIPYFVTGDSINNPVMERNRCPFIPSNLVISENTIVECFSGSLFWQDPILYFNIFFLDFGPPASCL